MAKKSTLQPKSNATLTVLWLGFLTGTLDAMAALIWSYITNPKVGADVIFEFIASGVHECSRCSWREREHYVAVARLAQRIS